MTADHWLLRAGSQGRESTRSKRHKGTFWSDGNGLCHDWYVSYTGVFFCQNSSTGILRVHVGSLDINLNEKQFVNRNNIKNSSPLKKKKNLYGIQEITISEKKAVQRRISGFSTQNHLFFCASALRKGTCSLA